jgi:uncharacterized membrane protein YphA (DoxX/SURF4 family)
VALHGAASGEASDAAAAESGTAVPTVVGATLREIGRTPLLRREKDRRTMTGTTNGNRLRLWARRLPLWLCVVQAILAYEWLVSGLDKLLDRGFSGQLSALLSQGTQGTAGSLYGGVIAHLVLPNHTLIALLTPWTETSIGSIMLLGAVLWMVYPRAHITDLVAGVACLALLTAATLDLNYYLLGGRGAAMDRSGQRDPARR